MDAHEAAARFDRAFGTRAPLLGLRPETPADRDLLLVVTMRCSPLAEVLPPALLEQQARMQYDAHRGAYPGAMRRVVTLDGAAIGSLIVNWTVSGTSRAVDIAIVPQARPTGAGLHLLRAWIEVADRAGRVCHLSVLATNPVRQLYRRLGFVEVAIDGVKVEMRRPPHR